MYYELFTENTKRDLSVSSFGIKAVSIGGEIVKRIHSISLDFDAVNRLVNLMNEENAELVHFEEIVEDFLSL